MTRFNFIDPMPRQDPRFNIEGTAVVLVAVAYIMMALWLITAMGCAQLGLAEPKTVEDRLLYAASQRNAYIDIIAAKKADGSLAGERLSKAKDLAWDMGRVLRAANEAVALGRAVKPDGCQTAPCDAPLTPEAALGVANQILLGLKELLK